MKKLSAKAARERFESLTKGTAESNQAFKEWREAVKRNEPEPEEVTEPVEEAPVKRRGKK